MGIDRYFPRNYVFFRSEWRIKSTPSGTLRCIFSYFSEHIPHTIFHSRPHSTSSQKIQSSTCGARFAQRHFCGTLCDLDAMTKFLCNDALVIWLMRDSTPKGNIDEVCIDSWKKMAIGVDSGTVGLVTGQACWDHSKRWVFVPPRDDGIVVWMMLFSFSSCMILLPDIQ
jgi:hypothetical protein